MPKATRRREAGRGERVLPGIWRLRLPLPFPGIPHCNAWALAAGDGIVLVDCGMDEPGSVEHLELALEHCGLRLEDVRLLVCTHAHPDHYGQAAAVVERAGCELWMHPAHEHATSSAQDPEAAVERIIEIARQSGVPEKALRGLLEDGHVEGSGIGGVVLPARHLTTGVEVRTDAGVWTVHETPGHAPSHVSLFLPGKRLLISGDHLLGRVALYYEYGWTPDPVGEFLSSLDVVERLDARLCLPGHGRTFSDVHAHIEANRRLVAERLARVLQVVRAAPGVTAFEALPRIYEQEVAPEMAGWWLAETLCYLSHLERGRRVVRVGGEDGAPERWNPGRQNLDTAVLEFAPRCASTSCSTATARRSRSSSSRPRRRRARPTSTAR